MRSWQRAAVVVTAMVALTPSPAMAEPGDEFESATVVSGLSVVVERAGERLVAGRETDYTIGVSNRGEQVQEVRVRVTVPPWMPEVTPHDGGTVGSGFVEWPVTVAPGQVTMLRMTGAYASPDREVPTRVAFTACALGTEDNQPIVCATDIARLESGSSGIRWWQIALIAVAVVVAGGAAFVFLQRRRSRPEPPTEAAAADAPLASA